MKKILCFVVVSIVFFVAASCGSGPVEIAETEPPDAGGIEHGDNRLPYTVTAARSDSGDILVGVGTSRVANVSVARSIATMLAMGDLSMQLQAFVTILVNDYVASSGDDAGPALLFSETIIQVLSQATIRGATVVHEHTDEDGNFWVVIALDRNNSLMEIESAAMAASMQAPGFNADIFAMDRVDRAFDSLDQSPWEARFLN